MNNQIINREAFAHIPKNFTIKNMLAHLDTIFCFVSWADCSPGSTGRCRNQKCSHSGPFLCTGHSHIHSHLNKTNNPLVTRTNHVIYHYIMSYIKITITATHAEMGSDCISIVALFKEWPHCAAIWTAYVWYSSSKRESYAVSGADPERSSKSGLNLDTKMCMKLHLTVVWQWFGCLLLHC